VSRLEGKVAIVTGAARGIGLAIVRAFVAEGATVVAADNRAPTDVPQLLTRSAGATVYVRADVSVEADVSRMVTTTVERLGRIDILVNNAGIFSHCRVVDMPLPTWERVVAVNLGGAFLCSKHVLPHMLARRSGRIINVASQLGQSGAAGAAHYSSSKGGLIAFTKALAREVVDEGVLVNAIAPGPIATDLMSGENASWKRHNLGPVPIGRDGRVEEVAPTAVFLASDDASYYVGQTLGPNGGDVML
jgi:3-oxoacyl-[acyl-carrier protein] reductase